MDSSRANGVAKGSGQGSGPLEPTDPALATEAGAYEKSPVSAISASARATSPVAAKRKRQRKPKITCADCFFQRNMLCALDTVEPCPTFRHHEQGLKPPRQLSFVFRQERTRAAWVFEQRLD